MVLGRQGSYYQYYGLILVRDGTGAGYGESLKGKRERILMIPLKYVMTTGSSL